MTEYGEKLVEAGAHPVAHSQAQRRGFPEGYPADEWAEALTRWRARPDHVLAVDYALSDTRAALLAFLDKLIEEGPSEGMMASATVANQRIGDGYLTDDELGQLFTVMLRTLRAEIAAPDQAREGAR